jgi:F-type H+-transporting ATPase subunit epsilon
MKKIPVDIVTPDRTEKPGEFDFVVLPGSEGELGVLPGHAHLTASLRAGTMRMTADGAAQSMTIAPGFCIVTPERITVLTPSARKA